MKSKIRGYIGVITLSVFLAGCIDGLKPVDREPGKGEYQAGGEEILTVYCPHPLEFINPIVSEFELRTGIQVTVQGGGTGQLLEWVESGKEPKCDVFWGGSLSTTMPKRELFEPYISSNEDKILEEYRNLEGNMTRFTDIPSVLMVNENLLGDVTVEGYGDLLQPELKGRIAMCDPSISSSAYEHLINMLYAMGEGDPEKGWPYVEGFVEQLDGKLVASSSMVYKGVADGRFAVGLTFEEGAAGYVSGDSPVKIIYMKEGVISKPDAVCIVKGSDHMAEAEAFVDFVTGKDAQTMISSTLNRRSVRVDVEGPEDLPDKSDLMVIFDEEQVVNDQKDEWLEHFSRLFRNSRKEDGG